MANSMNLRIRYFLDHAESWDADDHFEGRPVTFWSKAFNRLRLAWQYFVTPVICAVEGHTYIDNDPGDPEVGPQPEVFCTRCGKC